jgi:uncharacterized protein YjbI with pentapeptide repeats
MVKTVWGIGVAVCGAIAGVTAYVKSVDDGRHAREAKIDSAISSLRAAPTEAARNRILDSLGTRGLAEHLEPRAIQGLQGFIQRETRLSAPCAPLSTGSLPRRRTDVDSAFRIIAAFQAPNRGHHNYPDRFVDAILAWVHGEPAFVATPLALNKSDLRGGDLHGVNMRGGTFVGSCLSGANFESSNLDGARFDRATLDGASFVKASLRSASFAGAHGAGVSFDRGDLTGSDLTGATLQRARFFGATLSCATLGNAHLDDAYLSAAIANWAFFGGAYLLGATQWEEITDFNGAYIAGVHDLPASLIEFAHSRGAVPDTTNQVGWTSARSAQLARPGGCAQSRRS